VYGGYGIGSLASSLAFSSYQRKKRRPSGIHLRLVTASQDTISQIFFVFSLTFLIPSAGLTHCIANSSEFLISVFSGKETWAEYT
jgi:hypothetical protein